MKKFAGIELDTLNTTDCAVLRNASTELKRNFMQYAQQKPKAIEFCVHAPKIIQHLEYCSNLYFEQKHGELANKLSLVEKEIALINDPLNVGPDPEDLPYALSLRVSICIDVILYLYVEAPEDLNFISLLSKTIYALDQCLTELKQLPETNSAKDILGLFFSNQSKMQTTTQQKVPQAHCITQTLARV